MVIIGTGQDDPRGWVQAAYLLLDAAEEAGPSGKLPSRSQIATKLGICEATVARAYRELTEMGIIYWVPGLGYFGDVQ